MTCLRNPDTRHSKKTPRRVAGTGHRTNKRSSDRNGQGATGQRTQPSSPGRNELSITLPANRTPQRENRRRPHPTTHHQPVSRPCREPTANARNPAVPNSTSHREWRPTARTTNPLTPPQDPDAGAGPTATADSLARTPTEADRREFVLRRQLVQPAPPRAVRHKEHDSLNAPTPAKRERGRTTRPSTADADCARPTATDRAHLSAAPGSGHLMATACSASSAVERRSLAGLPSSDLSAGEGGCTPQPAQ